eukprot:gene46377-57829_t
MQIPGEQQRYTTVGVPLQTSYSSVNPYRPFCSARCKGVDLGAWA